MILLLQYQRKEADVADLCENQTILICTVFEERDILHLQLAMTLFAMLLYEVHNLLKLGTL